MLLKLIKKIKNYLFFLNRNFHPVEYCKYAPEIDCLYPKRAFKDICPNKCPFKSRRREIFKADRAFKAIKPIPSVKSFKPRPAHEKRLWKSDQKMPRKFKDEDED